MGLFTLKPIPQNTYICAYAPTASMRAASNQGDDYVIDVPLGEKVVAVNKSCSCNSPQNPYEAGLGIYINNGSFSFFLVPSKFSKLVASRINCEFSNRGRKFGLKQNGAFVQRKSS